MSKLSNDEKEMILYCHKEYSKWFISNKIKLSESNNKFKAFLFLVSEFFMLRNILREHIVTKYNLYNWNSTNIAENVNFAALFGVDEVCEPALIHLENERFFWGYFGFSVFILDLPSLELNNLEKSTLPFKHKKYSIDKKSSAFQAFMYIAQSYAMKNLGRDIGVQVINNFKKDIEFHCENIIDNSNRSKEYFHSAIKSNNIVRIYRGFNYNEELNVRSGRYLKNNPNAQTQDDGKSISFTLERKIAKEFAINYFEAGSHIKEWSKRVNGNELLLKINNFNGNDFLREQKRRPAIGTYEVAVDDILLYSCLPGASEYEIMVFPEKAKLIRYDNIKYS
jgi:hypothetical protein